MSLHEIKSIKKSLVFKSDEEEENRPGEFTPAGPVEAESGRMADTEFRPEVDERTSVAVETPEEGIELGGNATSTPYYLASTDLPMEVDSEEGGERGVKRKERSSSQESNQEGSRVGGRIRKITSQCSPTIIDSIDLSEESDLGDDLVGQLVSTRGRGDVSAKPIRDLMKDTPKNPEVLSGWSAHQLREYMSGWIEDIETIRGRTKSMQGKISNYLKVRLQLLQFATALITERVEDNGDPAILRRQNIESSVELERLRRENSLLTKELEIRCKIIESYQASDERVAAKEQWKHTEVVAKSSEAGASGEYGEQRTSLRTDADKKRSIGRKIVQEDFRNRGGAEMDDDGFLQPPLPQRVPRERKEPRVISNVRVNPPKVVQFEKPALDAENNETEDRSSASEWELADRVRKRAKKHRKKLNMESDGKEVVPVVAKRMSNSTRAGNVGSRRRAPRSAAISIKRMSQELSYADILRKARTNVSMNELGINDTRIRKAANGAVIIEILGDNSKGNAEKLKNKLKQVFGEDEVQISRPEIKGDLRIVGFDDSVLGRDISVAIRTAVKCDEEDVRVGAIRPMKNGLFMTWVQCPLAIAIRVAALVKLQVGWTSARIELLGPKPVQCFKCWSFGHVKMACRSEINRVGNCFRCGQSGHAIMSCNNEFCCLPCKDIGRDFKHRMGSYVCGSRSMTSQNKV